MNMLPIDLHYYALEVVTVVGAADLIRQDELPRLHLEAVKSALQYWQDNLALTRVDSIRKDECGSDKADVPATGHEHGANHEGKMHMNSNCQPDNVGGSSDGQTRSLHAPLIFGSKKIFSPWYKAKVAELMTLQIELARHGADAGAWQEP